MGENENLTRDEYLEKLEIVLIDRARCTCKLTKQTSKCRCYSNENLFILAQFYFDTSRQRKAYQIFDTIKHEHKPSMYQLGVILYDDLIDIQDKNSDQNIFNDTQSTDGNETQASFLSSEQNVSNWEKGFQCMLSVAESEGEEHEKSMIHAAQFNVGMAYFSGFAVKQSNTEAEKWWLRAANDGDPKACVTAMTTLAFFYSQPIDKETFDLKKAFFWHNEACGNGSLESQGALGSMYYYGIGVKKNINAAYECLTNASERGNVYSMGILSEYYYKNKFFAKAFELSKK
jgi:TPR repeat protein